MGQLVLWTCFLAVVAGIVLCVAYLVREDRRRRRARPKEASVVSEGLVAKRAPLLAAARPGASRLPQDEQPTGRGLHSLLPGTPLLVEQRQGEEPDAAPPRRGLAYLLQGSTG